MADVPVPCVDCGEPSVGFIHVQGKARHACPKHWRAPAHPNLFVTYELRHPAARVPTYANPGDAGADLYAVNFDNVEWMSDEVTFLFDDDGQRAGAILPPQCTVLVHTFVAVAIPEGWEGSVRPRSGLAFNDGITTFHPVGTIDSPYRGTIDVMLTNRSPRDYTLRRGDKVAQIVFSPVGRATFQAGELPPSQRGAGGFGSSGK